VLCLDIAHPPERLAAKLGPVRLTKGPPLRVAHEFSSVCAYQIGEPIHVKVQRARLQQDVARGRLIFGTLQSVAYVRLPIVVSLTPSLSGAFVG
jgi:hypothetical protein